MNWDPMKGVLVLGEGCAEFGCLHRGCADPPPAQGTAGLGDAEPLRGVMLLLGVVCHRLCSERMK